MCGGRGDEEGKEVLVGGGGRGCMEVLVGAGRRGGGEERVGDLLVGTAGVVALLGSLCSSSTSSSVAMMTGSAAAGVSGIWRVSVCLL